MWLWLTAAIVAEVGGTPGLRYSADFSRLIPPTLVVSGYGVAFYSLSQVLTRGIPIGVGLRGWSAIGVAAIAVIGAVFLNEPLSWAQVGAIVLVIAGVLAIDLGRAGAGAI